MKVHFLVLFLSLELCGAAQQIRNDLPTLFALCLQNLKKLPPTQFAQIQMLPPSVKEAFVGKYGPLYIPTLFNVEASDQNSGDSAGIIWHQSCKDMQASIDDAKTMRLYKKIDTCWHVLETVAHVDMFAFCPLGKRYAYTQGNRVSLCDMDDKKIPTRVIRCGGGRLNALAFHDDYLFIKGKTDRCEQEDLFVWNFVYDRHTECYSLWPENAKFMIDSYACRIIDKHVQDQTWLSYAFNQILFTCILDDIKTVPELELFKQYQDKLVCGPQSLFKQLTIAEKECKLKKSKGCIN